jgi:hypothetical protein
MATVEQAHRDAAQPDAPPQCAAFVFDNTHKWQCPRRGYGLSADGKHYCKQHHPESIEHRKMIQRERERLKGKQADERDERLEEMAKELGIGCVARTGIYLEEDEAALLLEFVTSGPHMRDLWNRTVGRSKVKTTSNS